MEEEPPSIRFFFTEDSHSDYNLLDVAELEKSATSMITSVNMQGDFEAGIKVVDGPTMASLHQQFMQDPTETDCMSFESEDEEYEQGYLGDIIVCTDVAAKEAKEHDHGHIDELLFYILHGLLHLCGYDDDTPEKRHKMLSIQAEALKSIGRNVAL